MSVVRRLVWKFFVGERLVTWRIRNGYRADAPVYPSTWVEGASLWREIVVARRLK